MSRTGVIQGQRNHMPWPPARRSAAPPQRLLPSPHPKTRFVSSGHRLNGLVVLVASPYKRGSGLHVEPFFRKAWKTFQRPASGRQIRRKTRTFARPACGLMAASTSPITVTATTTSPLGYDLTGAQVMLVRCFKAVSKARSCGVASTPTRPSWRTKAPLS